MAADGPFDEEHLHEDDEEGDASGKRRRVQRACDSCRKKKIRCITEPDKTACNNCTSYGLQCTFVDATKRRAPPRSYVIALEARMERAEQLIAQLLPTVDIHRAIGPMPELPGEGKREGESGGGSSSDPSLNAGRPVSLNQQQEQPPPLLGMHSAQSSEMSNLTSGDGDGWSDGDDAQDEDDAAYISYRLEDVNLNSNEPEAFIATFTNKAGHESFEVGGDDTIVKPWRCQDDSPGASERPRLFYGKASGFHMIPSLNKIVKPSDRTADPYSPNGLAPSESSQGNANSLLDDSELDLSRIAFRWPAPDVQDRLIKIYFARANPQYPVLNEVVFRRRLQQATWKTTDYETMMTVLGVFAIASRYLTSAEVQSMPQLPVSGQHWAKVLQSLLERQLIHPSANATYIQALLLSIIYNLATPINVRSLLWILIGVAVRLLQDMGAHRKFTAVNSNFSLLTAETYRRLWWVTYALDRIVSADLGRPVSIQDEDVDVDEIMLVDDEPLVHASESGTAPVQPADRPSMYAGFQQTARLSRIVGRTLRTIYAISKSKVARGFVGRKWDAYIVAEIDRSLAEWLEQVPSHLAYSPSEVNDDWLVQSSRIFMLYYYAQILVHRPFVQRYKLDTPLAFHSLAIVSNSGRSGIHVMQNLTDRGLASLLGPEAPIRTFIFSSHLLLISYSAARKNFNVSKALIADVRKGRDTLQKLSATWSIAGRMGTRLEYIVNNIDMPCTEDEPSPPSAKRMHDDDVAARSTMQQAAAWPDQGNQQAPALAPAQQQREIRGMKARTTQGQGMPVKLPLSTTELQGPFVNSPLSAMDQVAALSGWPQQGAGVYGADPSSSLRQTDDAMAYGGPSIQTTQAPPYGSVSAASVPFGLPADQNNFFSAFGTGNGFQSGIASSDPSLFDSNNRSAGGAPFEMAAMRGDVFLGGGALPTPGEMDMSGGAAAAQAYMMMTSGGQSGGGGGGGQHQANPMTGDTGAQPPQPRTNTSTIPSLSSTDPLDALSNLTGFWSDSDWMSAMQSTQQ